jgi:hypothetical protein
MRSSASSNCPLGSSLTGLATALAPVVEPPVAKALPRLAINLGFEEVHQVGLLGVGVQPVRNHEFRADLVDEADDSLADRPPLAKLLPLAPLTRALGFVNSHEGMKLQLKRQ